MDTHIVIQLHDRVVRGVTDLDDWIADIFNTESLLSPPIRTRELDGEHVGLEDVTAVFFVKSLDGGSQEELRYHDHLTPFLYLWVRVTFLDGKTVEGILRNDRSLVSGSRFVMVPVDPQSNNRIILVFKNQLADFRILGLRRAFDELPFFFHPPQEEVSLMEKQLGSPE